MKTYKYNIYRPGGNDTALVTAMVKNVVLKGQINKMIMKANPKVEQVGFVDKKNKVLEMAGGEFCGNATRAATYYFLGGKQGVLEIKTSGVKNRLLSGIKGNYEVWTRIPIYKDLKKITKIEIGYIVPMQGITHVVTEIPIGENIKKQGFDILTSLNLITKPAAGVIYVSKTKGGLKIDPVIWVRNIETLFYETACASGTAAVGLIQTLKQGKSINDLPILQPSQETISTTVGINKGKFETSTISGQVKILKTNLQVKI
ncbi:hypothetical protein IPM62_02770 [Candidatus Woesebacteria bacterium]|nr:MAG: hypothetical protein IPM62_02770 [Candidatus Woesebacteria bacterium]